MVLTEDLSKFYNQVKVDEMVQHVRRIVWWGGDPAVPVRTYILIVLSFGDKPAGCIAIVCLGETAEIFGNNSDAARFPTQSGAKTMQGLRKVSAELEEIVKQGGLCSKKWI